MNNYVLNRTNVLLGGQMKWDLRVKSIDDSTWYVDDFSLTPISHNINYVRPDVSILNNNHHDNIKELYSKTSDTFFSDCLDAKFITKYPIIADDKTKVDSYNSMYDNCVSRISRAKNGKSTQLFIPMWLEDFRPSDTIKFDIEIFIEDDLGNKTTSLYKTLELDLNGKSSHDAFVNYMRSYIENISTNGKIGDKIINVDFKNLKMIVEGIDLNTGHILTKDISNKLHNFTGMYKPFMDNDDMIIRSLSDNKLVAKQLFNFNIMFDFEDILSNYILDQIKGASVKFNIKTFINGTEVEEKSFSWDYSEKFNEGVLREFEDYNNIQLIDKNKINTNVIHWTLSKDSSYIFNLYPNFYMDNNIWTNKFEEDKTCINWCNNDILLGQEIHEKGWIESPTDTLYSNIKRYVSYKDFTVFTDKNKVINNVYYSGENLFPLTDLFLYILIVPDGAFKRSNGVFEDSRYLDSLGTLNSDYFPVGITVNIGGIPTDIEVYLYINNILNDRVEAILIVEKKNIDYLSFKKLTDPTNLGTTNSILYNIDYILNGLNAGQFAIEGKLSSYVESNILPFSCTVYPIRAKSPLQSINNSKENDFIKTVMQDQYLFRYDGDIKPLFTDPSINQYWQIKKINRAEYVTDWDKYIRTKFLPLYPSINYFYLENITDNDYCFEKKWFKESSVFALQNIIKITYNTTLINNEIISPVQDYIKSYLNNYYNINDNDVLDYIYDLYDVTYIYNYDTNILSPNNIEYNYEYNITLKLK